MVSDSEPRYRLVDSQGNTVGTLYAKSGGTLALQEGSSGSDNEIELQTDGTLQTDSINTEQVGNERHFAGAYNGSDPDARLDNAITEASSGDTIYLENAAYGSDRTFTTQYKIVGSGYNSSIDAAWTIDIDRFDLRDLSFTGLSGRDEITVTSGSVLVSLTDLRIGGGGVIQINADRCSVTDISISGDIIFDSSTSGGIADAILEGSVTDNGSNTVGDIA